jgi:hypothetical protein
MGKIYNITRNLHPLFSVRKMYGRPFWTKTHRNKGFPTTQKIVMLRIDFKEEQTLIQLCNGKIDEKTKHLHFVYTGVKNVKNSA